MVYACRVSIRATLRDAHLRLDRAGVDAPHTTARVLLSQVTGKRKEWLIAHDEQTLETADELRFEALLLRVLAREPLAYVLGEREFYGLPLTVDRRVLIPRPETEMLVELTLEILRERPTGAADAFDLIDVGTGSGAIPIAVAMHLPRARILASDVSLDALDVARANADRHVPGRVQFQQSNLLDRIDGLPVVLTANLPYVTRAEIFGLPPEIQAHEPIVALDGGEDGLDLVRGLLEQIGSRLQPAAAIEAAFFEIGASQGPAALNAAHAILPGRRAAVLKDLGRRDRVLALHF
jgi:release factor glutamine methyltransferase